MKIKDILAVKGSRVVTIAESTSIFEAMLVFSANRIGSLLVIDKHENIRGIICARDVLMATIHHYEDIKTMTVDSIMTTHLIVGRKEDDLDYVRALMTKNRIRHSAHYREQEVDWPDIHGRCRKCPGETKGRGTPVLRRLYS